MSFIKQQKKKKKQPKTCLKSITKSSKVCLTRLPTRFPTWFLTRLLVYLPILSLTRPNLLCYANEMNILRAFLCRYFFRTIDSHECLRENMIMIQICPTMRKFGQYYFWKFLTTSLSGATLPLKDCGSLAFHENWGKSSCQYSLGVVFRRLNSYLVSNL